MKIHSDAGFGNYIIINSLEYHYVIELLGFQKIANKPKFVIEDKTFSYNINYLLNGGKISNDYSNFKPAIEVSNNASHIHFVNFVFASTSDKGFLKKNFDEIVDDYPYFNSDDSDLPFIVNNDTTGLFFNNFLVFSKMEGIYSFRRHSSTIIITKNTNIRQFNKILNSIFNINDFRKNKSLNGWRKKSDIISELKSLAYHKVHETTIDKFLQLNSHLFAKALGYKSAKSNINLELQVHKDKFEKNLKLIPDFMLEREDGFYDFLDLKVGLLSYDFALGNWSNARFSSYGQNLLGQLKGYKRYFSSKENADWVYDKYKVKIKDPKLIGIAGNHNNFIHETVKLALENHSNDFVLYSYNDLAKKMKDAL
ncbi:hypothetical protein [Aureibaculum conchae]|uniref:hypothetical protein n=1 Tax=Aureibaculum sp. 2308TA14-22 TaxID=3108392 RepID=UPI0033907CAA